MKIRLKKIASIHEPVALALRKGDSAFYIAQRHDGTIRPVRNGKAGDPVLDIGSEISTGNEQGLLGLAFSADGTKLYVDFTSLIGGGASGDDVVRQYTFSNGKAVPSSARDLIRVADPYPNHNGGNLVFGPDTYLYIGMGDGGAGGDPQNRAQNTRELLGKLLRIDPGSGAKGYTVPDDNPFGNEVWAYGLRNPWRFSFDRLTNDLWIADVGQNEWEEIDFDPSGGGDNYGWSRMEGRHGYNGGTPPANHHGPIYEYSHSAGNCSVTGGYVYRGRRIPDLYGSYVFADYCAGRLRAFVRSEGRATGARFLGPQVDQVSSFGQDAGGELYVLSLSGAVYRIDPA